MPWTTVGSADSVCITDGDDDRNLRWAALILCWAQSGLSVLLAPTRGGRGCGGGGGGGGVEMPSGIVV